MGASGAVASQVPVRLQDDGQCQHGYSGTQRLSGIRPKGGSAYDRVVTRDLALLYST